MTDAPDSLPDTTTNPNAGPTVRWRTLLVIVAVALVLIYGVLLVARWALTDNTPELTDEALAAAQERWQANGPASYDMELELSGARPGNVHVEVRNGQVTRLIRDGKTPPKHTWDVWSVPGLFDMLGRNLEIAADPATEIGATQDTQWILRARFDPKLAYPQLYRQIVVGTGPEVTWEVRRFQVVD